MAFATISLGVKNFVSEIFGSTWKYHTLLGVASKDQALEIKSGSNKKTVIISQLDDVPMEYDNNQTTEAHGYNYMIWIIDNDDMETHQMALNVAFNLGADMEFEVTGYGYYNIQEQSGQHIKDDTDNYYEKSITVYGN